VSYRPSGAVELTMSPGYFWGRSPAQFVGRQTDGTATATFGRRYLFAELMQHSVDLSMRLNVTMSPVLSFQFYAQPFNFTGDYSGFKELRAPRTFDFNVYGRDNNSTVTPGDPAVCGTATANECSGIDPDGAGPAAEFALFNPDFRTRSLISNAVLRWEYRPGSTFFLVWTQNRGSFVPFDPAFSVTRDFQRELFLDRPQNVLLVKVNYWLSL
jgi:hypothetical protein